MLRVKKFMQVINFHSAFLAFLMGFLLSAGNGIAQDYPGFSSEVVSKMNTAADATYLSDDEKEVVLFINLIRYNGAAFWQHHALPYIKTHEIPHTKYVRSLERELKATKNLAPLYPSKALFDAAKTHAVASGKEGVVGHRSSAGSFEKRLKPLSDRFNYILENCDYGSSGAMDILMNLMIDEGIPDVGHRKNILHPEIDAIGLAIAPHKNYRYTCVQVFAKQR